MEKIENLSAILKDVAGAFPFNAAAFEDAYNTSVSLNEKLSRVALEAAEKSTEITNLWAKDTIAKLTEVSKAKTDPAEYAAAYANFVSGVSETAGEKMFAFAEVAKKAQMDTVELLISAGNGIANDAATFNNVASKTAPIADKAKAA
ncbi:phasin family protein [Ruegeria arenilitoris]|uniref:phasin family protein n=1 Tax=Ruegeria arenilitoris TaxID=1173585 RepID=UPI00147F5FF6|nr:phasin family protein [Ruegeria arenilitoris]